MRLAAAVIPALILALCGPVQAGCFTADAMPERALYDGGSMVEYLSREGDVLTYRSGPATVRVQSGLWPLDSRAGGSVTEYRWEGALPDLPAIIAAGGKARVQGKLRMAGAGWLPVLAEVEVLGQQEVPWEDCRYSAVEYRKRFTVDGKAVSDGVVLYAPGAMISFRTTATDPATGKVTAYRLAELQ